MSKIGLLHIYTGDGKGKTTSAIGLGIRACGSGMKVLLVQFLKSRDTSELCIIKKLEPDFIVLRGFNCKKFVRDMTEDEVAKARSEASEIFGNVKTVVEKGEYDLIILDEILGVLSLGFIGEDSVIEMVNNKPETVELVLTGRDAPDSLIKLADYVSLINAVKHPYEKGVSARKGIEF